MPKFRRTHFMMQSGVTPCGRSDAWWHANFRTTTLKSEVTCKVCLSKLEKKNV